MNMAQQLRLRMNSGIEALRTHIWSGTRISLLTSWHNIVYCVIFAKIWTHMLLSCTNLFNLLLVARCVYFAVFLYVFLIAFHNKIKITECSCLILGRLHLHAQAHTHTHYLPVSAMVFFDRKGRWRGVGEGRGVSVRHHVLWPMHRGRFGEGAGI